MKFYFTFGGNTTLKKNYVVIDAMTSDHARVIMASVYGERWGFQYTDEDNAFLSKIKQRYGLTEVPLGTPCDYENRQHELN
jgi:hypothetical protein